MCQSHACWASRGWATTVHSAWPLVALCGRPGPCAGRHGGTLGSSDGIGRCTHTETQAGTLPLGPCLYPEELAYALGSALGTRSPPTTHSQAAPLPPPRSGPLGLSQSLARRNLDLPPTPRAGLACKFMLPRPLMMDAPSAGSLASPSRTLHQAVASQAGPGHRRVSETPRMDTGDTSLSMCRQARWWGTGGSHRGKPWDHNRQLSHWKIFPSSRPQKSKPRVGRVGPRRRSGATTLAHPPPLCLDIIQGALDAAYPTPV